MLREMLDLNDTGGGIIELCSGSTLCPTLVQNSPLILDLNETGGGINEICSGSTLCDS